jgi:tetratricopeptide (TPR) repeat protein
MKHFLLFLTLVIFFSKSLQSQTTNTSSWRETERDSMANAFKFYEEKKFSKALPYYENIYNNHPNEVFVKYMYGISLLNNCNKFEYALKMLQDVYEENPEIDYIELDLSKALFFNYKFDDATKMMDRYIANKRTTVENKSNAELLKKHILNAKFYHAKPTSMSVSNFGTTFNTPDNEFSPLISADESVLIYSHNGEKSKKANNSDSTLNTNSNNVNFNSDMFMSVKINDQLQSPLPIENLNTTDEEMAVGLSQDAQVLFTHKYDTSGNGDIYESRFNGSTYSSVSKLRGTVNTNSYEGHCSLSPDGKLLYFSSNRPGGFGGKDIYKAVLMPDSTWGDVVNMGDSINTIYDEDFPFIHYDGSTLYFSSNSQKSCGGFDVFKSNIDQNNNTIIRTENMGFPLNSPFDDVNFVLASNGLKGYLNCFKPGGQGLNDIYIVEIGNDTKKPLLYSIKGNVTYNESPIEATIKIEITSKGNMLFNTIKTVAATGNYIVSLPLGQSYKLTFTCKNQNPRSFDYNASEITDYQEIINNIKFGGNTDSLNYLSDKGNTNTSATNKLSKEADKAAITLLQKKISRYAATYGKISADGLAFKVQISAIKVFDKSKFKHLKRLGKIEADKFNDDIFRVTSNGKFKTLEKAWEHNKKVIQAGQTDAFVTVYYQGKRVSFEELIKMGIYK